MAEKERWSGVEGGVEWRREIFGVRRIEIFSEKNLDLWYYNPCVGRICSYVTKGCCL